MRGFRMRDGGMSLENVCLRVEANRKVEINADQLRQAYTGNVNALGTFGRRGEKEALVEILAEFIECDKRQKVFDLLTELTAQDDKLKGRGIYLSIGKALRAYKDSDRLELVINVIGKIPKIPVNHLELCKVMRQIAPLKSRKVLEKFRDLNPGASYEAIDNWEHFELWDVVKAYEGSDYEDEVTEVVWEASRSPRARVPLRTREFLMSYKDHPNFAEAWGCVKWAVERGMEYGDNLMRVYLSGYGRLAEQNEDLLVNFVNDIYCYLPEEMRGELNLKEIRAVLRAYDEVGELWVPKEDTGLAEFLHYMQIKVRQGETVEKQKKIL